MIRSGSSMRLDSSQHEELLLNLDPGLLMRTVQQHNNFVNTSAAKEELINNYVTQSSQTMLEPGHFDRANNGSTRSRRSSQRIPISQPQRMASLPAMMIPSPSITPRIMRRQETREFDMASLSSGMTLESNQTSPSYASDVTKKKKKSGKENEVTMSADIMPYVSSAMELAAGQLGAGTSLRKVSVVRQNHPNVQNGDGDDSPRGLFKKKKKSKKDLQTSLVFSFGKEELSQNYQELVIQAMKNYQRDPENGSSPPSRKQSNDSLDETPNTPQISVTEFSAVNDPTYEGRPLARYDSNTTLTTEVETTVDGSSPLKGSNILTSQFEEKVRKASYGSSNDESAQRKRTLDQIQNLQNQMLNPNSSRFQFDNRSVRSYRSQSNSERVTSTSGDALKVKSEQEKKRERLQRFWDSWTMISSIIYAIVILVLAIIIYTLDIFVFREGTPFGGRNMSEYYNVFLAALGSAWIIWLLYDINKYTEMMKTYWQNGSTEEQPKIEFVQGEDGELLISIPISSSSKQLPQYYCFSTGRHSGSFFLKSGATFFCLGHIIHITLNMVKQIVFFAEEKEDIDCGSVGKLLFQIFQTIFVVLQLYMMFKYSNVIVNRSKGMARFAFMHCIATSLTFWMYTLVNETIDSIVKKYFDDGLVCFNGNDGDDDDHKFWRLPRLRVADTNDSKLNRCPDICEVQQHASQTFQLDIDCLVSMLCNCNFRDESNLTESIFKFGDYLYPFSIEFSILIVGVWYIIWSNIGKVEDHKDRMEFLPTPRGSFDSGIRKPNNKALLITADCHSTIKGIFLGICHLALCIVGTIVYMVLYDDEQCIPFRITNDVIECLLLGSMIAAAIWVYVKIAHLDINPHPISFLDDLLLFICMPSFFLYCLLSSIPAMINGIEEYSGNIVTNLLMLVQVLIQTPMIVDGLRRCCDGQRNQEMKPGRNLVTFLLIANLSLYIWDTLEAKSDGYGDIQKEFYGSYLWIIVKHMTLPLCIFYRFHSAVALADIWNSAYQPGDHH